jgi:Tol biopolymer transport system component
MAYIPQSILSPPRRLVWVNREGSEEAIAAAPRAFADPRLSPDGRRMVVSTAEINSDLWVYELPRGAPSRLTHEPTFEASPVWTADGRRIIYTCEDLQFKICWRPADGDGEEELLYSSEYDLYPTDVSPDGKLLAFLEDHPTTDGDIWILSLDNDRQPTPIARTRFEEGYGAFSPDGRWLAYQSRESGRFEIYVQGIAGPGSKIRVSTEGGQKPSWSRDGKELYFRQGHKMMAATIESGAELRVGKPVTLFEGHYGRYWASRAYDVAPDGRFLMVKTPEELAPRQLNVVLNWFAELERLVPAE